MDKQISIILIDDDDSVLTALKLLLNAIGFSVSAFNTGKEALITIENGFKPDYILCDLRMPEMDGFDVLQTIKQTNPNIPFILISGHATEEDIQKAKTLGMQDFLAKPFTPEDLNEILIINKP